MEDRPKLRGRRRVIDPAINPAGLRSASRLKPGGMLEKKGCAWRSQLKKRQAMKVKARLIHRPTRLNSRVGNLKATHAASGGKTSGPNWKRARTTTSMYGTECHTTAGMSAYAEPPCPASIA